MEKNLYIDASHPDETRIVLKSEKHIEEYEYENKNKVNLKNKILKESYKKSIYLRPVWRLISEMKSYRKNQKMNLSGAKEIYKKTINLPSSQSLILK